MTTKDIVRRQIIADIVSRMSDDDRRDYILYTQGEQVRNALDRQDAKLDEITRRTSWARGFTSDLGANAVSYAAFLLITRLLK